MPYTYDYPRPMVTVDAAVFKMQRNSLHILLVKRKNDPFKDCWAIPGGFVEMNESLDEAVARELEEETGLKNVLLMQLYTYGDVDRDPRGRTITVLYYGYLTDSKTKVKGNDDASEAKWFPINNLPPLAFDHNKICEHLKAIIPEME